MATQQHTRTEIATVVAAYFVISIALVFSNKLLLTPGSSFAAPIFVTWFQCLLTAVLIYLLGLVSSNAKAESVLKEFPFQTYDQHTALKVLPLSVIFVAMVTFNNLCLQYVEVSFYNVARSLTIVFNVIFTYTLLGEKTSLNTMACLLIVIFGFFIGSDGEVNFSLLGTMFGVSSSVFVSLNSIYTKKVMPYVGDDKWRLAYYNNLNATYFFVPLIFLFGEHNIILANIPILLSMRYWMLMTIAGFLGFAIGIVTVMQINYTSPLTHNISGTAKACVQTFLALIVWQNATTVKGNVGLAMTIFGSGAYAIVRMRESDKQRASTGAYQPVTSTGQAPSAPSGQESGSPNESKRFLKNGMNGDDAKNEEKNADIELGMIRKV